MSGDVIARLLAGTFPDPDGAGTLSVATRAVIIAPSLRAAEAEILRPLALGRHLAVVSDRTTHAVLGERIERALAGAYRLTSVVLPERPHPDAATVESIRTATREADALVAVGSGTLNDLCKYAGALDGKPYVVFGTAPSMNGYTSTTAAITIDGHKKSLAAQAPLGVFLDLEVLTAAPPRLIRAGLGDSLCRPTAQADWLLAHRLFDKPYRTMPFVLLGFDEDAMLADSGALLAGDPEAMRGLVRTLILSGFGTAICGSSHPASQGEHLISHFADMFVDPAWPASYHGEQIGVTTLTLARLQERMLDGPAPVLRPDGEDEAGFVRRFGAVGRSCWAEYAQKRLSAAQAEETNGRLARDWERIRGEIAGILRPSSELESALARAGAPTTPEDLGWPRPFYRHAVRHARQIRNRYTFLDLAADSRRLDRLADELEGPAGILEPQMNADERR